MPRRIGLTVPLLRVVIWAVPIGIYSSVAMLKSRPFFADVPNIPAGLEAALSIAMALIIGFRVNRAYERWWEARTLWGTLVNVSRNLAVKVRALEHPTDEERQLTRNLVVAFAVALKDHLRDDADLHRLPGFADDPATPRHIPSYIVSKLYGLFAGWHAAGKLSAAQLWVLDADARQLLDVCGGCEKIKTTLISVSWRFFTWQCIAVYLIVLPWGLVDDFGTWTIPITMLAAYFVIAGEGIAHYVEEPFGEQEDHLRLENICETIDRSVSEVLLAQHASRD